MVGPSNGLPTAGVISTAPPQLFPNPPDGVAIGLTNRRCLSRRVTTGHDLWRPEAKSPDPFSPHAGRGGRSFVVHDGRRRARPDRDPLDPGSIDAP